jgi:hypothetical protein
LPGSAVLERAVEVDGVGNPREDAQTQPLAQRQQSLAFFCHLGLALISAALPKPTMPGTLSVPERMPRSWPPPSMMGVMRTRGLRRT